MSAGASEPRWVLPVIRVVAAFGTAAMISAIVGAFSVASFPEDGAAIVALAWGRVTLVDLYLAFLFGWLWIVWRERSVARAAAWGLATVVTGSLALFLYLLAASLRARTSMELLLGPNRSAAGG
ncbi:MAG: hypothetical protein EA340_06325 [Nitriliruptor sp.]|nr:MAG: hypothetical protein EA340_06325 [Nitriliruptor sp.]